VGWVIWRDQSDLPEELIFTVDYLGGSHDNFGLNFSRGASQIVAQYYNFIRLGRQGYRDVMQALAETASWLAAEIEGLGPFEMLGRGADLPVVCFRLAGSPQFTVFDLSDALRQRGWIVPAYAMAPDAEDIAVLRIVVREGLSADMASELVGDIRAALEHLEAKTATPAPVAAAKPAGAPGGRGGRRARGRPGQANQVKKTRAIC